MYIEWIAGNHYANEDAILFMVCDVYVDGRFWSCRIVYWDCVQVILSHLYCLTFTIWVQAGRLASCLDSNWAVNVAAHDDDRIFPSLHVAVLEGGFPEHHLLILMGFCKCNSTRIFFTMLWRHGC